MSKIVINGVELSLNLLDADVMEKYESEISRVVEEVQDPSSYEGMTLSQAMRQECRMIDEFFDRLFGDGTSAKAFNGSSDLRARLEGFGIVSNMSKTINSEVQEIKSKYSAERLANREQRRAVDFRDIKNNNIKKQHNGKKRH